MRLIRIAWWALSLALLDLSTARVSLVVSSETVKSKAPHWAATLGDAVAGVDHVAGSERTSPHDKVTTLTMTAQSSLDVPVSTTRSDLPWDVVRKRVEQLPPADADAPLELMRLLVDDADFFSAFDDGVVLVNASIDLCIGDVARWNRESCPSPGVHATVCVAHRDGDDVEKASFSKREVDARRRVAQFGKKAASLFSVWPLEFLEDDVDDFVSDHLVSRECRPGAKDVSCGATPLYRRMVTSVLSPPLQQRKYRSFDALGADEGRSLGRSHGHPSRPFCFVSMSLNPFNLCTDTLHRILKLMYARVFIQAQVDDDLNLGAEGAQDGDATNELVDLADFLMAVKSQVVVPRPLGSHQHHFPKSAADISIQRHRHALRFSPQLSKATDAATRIAEFFRSEADGVHASVQLHRSQRLHKEASVSFVSQVKLATFFTPENPVASPMLAMPHATQASESGDRPMRVDGLVELRGESHGRLRIRLVLNADPFDASESRVGAVDVVIRWPRLLYKPHLRSVRLVRVRGAEGTALEEDFMFNETSARIRSRTWGNLTSWAHPCFSNPILIGAITDVSLIEHIFRVGLVNSLACHNVLLRSNGTWSVDALIDFDFQHLHADEYAPDMNRYYGMPPIIARLRGERQFLSRSGRPRPVAEWATLLSPWIDSHVANVAESGAISPFETDELVKHLLATYVNRDWQLETWAISTDAGLYVNPPIPDRAMPFNALALWATVLALTVMTVLKVAVRSSAMELWGNDFDTDFKTTVSRETE